MKHLAKRVLSVLLATAMVLGLLPAVALAYTALPSDKTEVGDGTVYFVGYEWNRENGRFGHASSGPSGLFDRDGSTKICTGFDDYYEVEFSYNEPIVPNAYYFRTGGDTSFFPRRNPSAWTLSGRDENGDWIELDRQYNAQYTTENDTAVKFQIYNTRQYQQFKLRITDINRDWHDN